MNSLFVYAIIGAVAIFLLSCLWEEDEFRCVHRAVLHNSQRDMVIYDKNHYGFVSFSKYGPFQYAGLLSSLSTFRFCFDTVHCILPFVDQLLAWSTLYFLLIHLKINFLTTKIFVKNLNKQYAG